jgi:hypothetical protein
MDGRAKGRNGTEISAKRSSRATGAATTGTTLGVLKPGLATERRVDFGWDLRATVEEIFPEAGIRR